MLCIRFAAVVREDNPLANTRRFSNWCSQRDATQLIQRCIDAPETLRYDVFFANSDNKWGYFDIDHARRQVGYAPEDNAETCREEFNQRGGGYPVQPGGLPVPPPGWRS